jgi:GTPase
MTPRPIPQAADLVDGIGAGRVGELARAISMVENARPGFEDILSAIHRDLGRAHRIGITGPPGAGKSTLVDRMVEHYRRQDLSVAVVAVDPTSPFTGGAVLGDRVRMGSVALDRGVYIRSMATRGEQGGLATTTGEVCDVLDAYGFDRVLVETVGVGQTELAIAEIADTAMLVLVPESGDGVQVIKAGVMELADLFVVNKADRDGAEQLRLELHQMLETRRDEANEAVDGTAWLPPTILTTATAGTGVDELVHSLDRHLTWLHESGAFVERRRVRLARRTRAIVERALRRLVWRETEGDDRLSKGLEAVTEGSLSPYQLADEIVAAAIRTRSTGDA